MEFNEETNSRDLKYLKNRNLQVYELCGSREVSREEAICAGAASLFATSGLFGPHSHSRDRTGEADCDAPSICAAATVAASFAAFIVAANIESRLLFFSSGCVISVAISFLLRIEIGLVLNGGDRLEEWRFARLLKSDLHFIFNAFLFFRVADRGETEWLFSVETGFCRFFAEFLFVIRESFTER